MACYPPENETRYLNAKCDICELLIGELKSINYSVVVTLINNSDLMRYLTVLWLVRSFITLASMNS
jgi:hypothetical protein